MMAARIMIIRMMGQHSSWLAVLEISGNFIVYFKFLLDKSKTSKKKHKGKFDIFWREVKT